MNFVFVGQNILGGRALAGMVARGVIPQLVVTRPPNDYANLVEQTTKEKCLRLALTSNINLDYELISQVKDLNPQVIFCCSWGQRIGPDLLRLPPLGWVNFHPSYLPAYRGPCPIEWQLIEGLNMGGCTAHFMTSKFDAGPIIKQIRVPISEGDDGETLRHKCGEVIGEIAAECHRLLTDNPRLAGVPQDESLASYAGPREAARIINWGMPARRVIDWVRGLSPYPCVLLRYEGGELCVAGVTISTIRSCGDAGRVRGHEGGLLVGTGDYYVRVTKVRVGGQVVDLGTVKPNIIPS
ncbi:MAG TPA: formyltransferase family protein [Pyrinomonadaceae bacterium]